MPCRGEKREARGERRDWGRQEQREEASNRQTVSDAIKPPERQNARTPAERHPKLHEQCLYRGVVVVSASTCIYPRCRSSVHDDRPASQKTVMVVEGQRLSLIHI